MSYPLDISAFLQARSVSPVIDVRSPAEFARGHIPGALNLPLFTDQERMIVGKTYHLQGREEAVKEGLKAVGPKMQDFVASALEQAPGKEVLVYCWRGGMRSRSFGFLLETAGMKVRLLQGGYKAFRQHVLQHFNLNRPFRVIGGKTGSGKTDMLKELKAVGEQVIDLEGLANHKGSAFGHLGQAQQPSTEHFENCLWEKLQELDQEKVCWIEDESMTIGKVFIPKVLYLMMKASPMVLIDMPRELRANRLLAEYPGATEALKTATEGIRKRLGNDRKKLILNLLDQGDLLGAAGELLVYYDKAYGHSLAVRPADSMLVLPTATPDPKLNALKILAISQHFKPIAHD